ncbi:MAG: hypothetical protein AB7P16_28730 [Bradyrhizobium sp.]|uniref:hypothetical protein n=1 Tax=Bradyrhizobium sp. TaxID=376 RepID=UPI003D0A4998
MSAVLRARDADFSRGLGDSTSPFIAPANLVTAWDFLDYGRWKEGFVPGQTLTAYDQSSGSQVAGDAQISRSDDGLGLHFTEYGFARSNDATVPKFPNNTGVGQTMMALGASDRVVPGGTTTEVWFSIGWLSSVGGLALGVQRQVALDLFMAVVEQSAAVQKFTLGRAERASLLFLRANGDSTWSFIIPNLRFSVTLTDSDLSVGDPPLLDGVPTNPGKITFGNALPASAAQRSAFNGYQGCVWNRAFTDDEIHEGQYQRSRLRFSGILT